MPSGAASGRIRRPAAQSEKTDRGPNGNSQQGQNDENEVGRQHGTSLDIIKYSARPGRCEWARLPPYLAVSLVGELGEIEVVGEDAEGNDGEGEDFGAGFEVSSEGVVFVG